VESLNVVFTGKDKVAVRQEPLADEPRPGHLLIETQATLISTGTECICLQRKFEPGTNWEAWVKYPFYPGYSNVGRVLKVGEGVEGWEEGDRVATSASHRQFYMREPSGCVRVPAGVSDEAATWTTLATTVQNATRRAEHELGDVVAIIGVGLLGQLAVQYARLSGAREVIAIDPCAMRLEMAAAHGATETLAMGAQEALEPVRELTAGRLADVVYDVTGHSAVLPHALRMVRRLGKMVLLGDTGTPSEQRLTSDLIVRGLRLIGAHSTNPPRVASDHAYWTHANMAELFLLYLQREQMKVDDLITHRFPASEAPQAYEMLLTDRSQAMGVVFNWGPA